jgi:hypothetical protein
MKRFLIICALSVLALPLAAQVPQFSADEFAGWSYSNPAIELNTTTILGNRIVLYTTSTGLALTLTSPEFHCNGGQTIDMMVTWITDQWESTGFDASKVGLTAALLNAVGEAVDSVTFTFTPESVGRTNKVPLSIKVPRGMTAARLRFASWKGDVNSNGAVRQIVMTSKLKGDVNLDKEISIADVNAIIGVILKTESDDGVISRADVNGDREVSIADLNEVVDIIIGK